MSDPIPRIVRSIVFFGCFLPLLCVCPVSSSGEERIVRSSVSRAVFSCFLLRLLWGLFFLVSLSEVVSDLKNQIVRSLVLLLLFRFLGCFVRPVVRSGWFRLSGPLPHTRFVLPCVLLCPVRLSGKELTVRSVLQFSGFSFWSVVVCFKLVLCQPLHAHTLY